MTYQAFPNIEVFNVKDEGCIREFDIMVSGDKYITQDDIYFNIKYSNINYEKMEKIKKEAYKNINSICNGNLEVMNELKMNLNLIEDELRKKGKRDTPLSTFQEIEIYYCKLYDPQNETLIARRSFFSLNELIKNEEIKLTELFPGLKFTYFHCMLKIRFKRSHRINECLNFTCNYNMNDLNIKIEGTLEKRLYYEYRLPSGFGNLLLENEGREIKIIPFLHPEQKMFEDLDIENYEEKYNMLLEKIFKKLKFKYYLNGLEIDKDEFGKLPGLYHIKLLNPEDVGDDLGLFDVKYIIAV